MENNVSGFLMKVIAQRLRSCIGALCTSNPQIMVTQDWHSYSREENLGLAKLTQRSSESGIKLQIELASELLFCHRHHHNLISPHFSEKKKKEETMCSCTHIHTYAHTNTNICMHAHKACTHNIHTGSHMQTDIHIHKTPPTYMLMNKLACTHAYM